MAISKTSVDIQGLNHLDKALSNLGDSKGTKWKRQVFNRAGKLAFKPVVTSAKQKAPFGKTGLLKRTITTTTKFKARPRSTAKYQHEYTIGTTWGAKFNADAPKDRKQRAIRYPFMVEVGVPPQTYPRVGTRGTLHSVHRKAPRKPQPFQARALGSKASQATGIFTRELDRGIQAAAAGEYKTLSAAVKAHDRRNR